MKTIKFIPLIMVIVLTSSCNTYFRMVTTMKRNGTSSREIYAKADSAFIKGDLSKNPYFFKPGHDWKIGRTDSIIYYDFFGENKELNVKISREVSSVDLYSKGVQYNPELKSFATPQESLSKKFGWFYTKYTFKAVYKKLVYNVPLPVDKFLTKEEQMLWGQGQLCKYTSLNGSEMSDKLREIEGKVIQWYARNCFELSLSGLLKYTHGYNITEQEKDKIYGKLFIHDTEPDINPVMVSGALDSYYKTDLFTKAYNANREAVDKESKRAESVFELLGYVISYELKVPGKLLDSNSSINRNGSLIWKVDGIRILFNDYTITAEYRVTNIWAFIVAALLILTAIVSYIFTFKRKKSF
jgi:hypothetical protein